MSKEMSTR